MPDSQPLLIATLPPTRAQRWTAVVVSVLLFAVFLLVLRFAHVQLAKVDAFIPVVAAVMFLNDSIAATLLFAQFAILRSRALLVLANGYLFTALTIIPYALTFPDTFAPRGILGACEPVMTLEFISISAFVRRKFEGLTTTTDVVVSCMSTVTALPFTRIHPSGWMSPASMSTSAHEKMPFAST